MIERPITVIILPFKVLYVNNKNEKRKEKRKKGLIGTGEECDAECEPWPISLSTQLLNSDMDSKMPFM